MTGTRKSFHSFRDWKKMTHHITWSKQVLVSGDLLIKVVAKANEVKSIL